MNDQVNIAADAQLPIEIWDIERLVPFATNAKKHPADQISKLAAAIRQFGWTQPIIVWTNGSIIAGHGRRLAALKLGLKRVPVVIRSDLTEAEAAALRIADNKVASTEYDAMLLGESVKDLLGQFSDSFDLQALGLEDRELEFFTADLGEMNETGFTDDIGSAVSEQAASNKDSADKFDKETVHVSRIFGTKTVTIAQFRKFRKLMEHVETKTQREGIEALMQYLYWGVKGKL